MTRPDSSSYINCTGAQQSGCPGRASAVVRRTHIERPTRARTMPMPHTSSLPTSARSSSAAGADGMGLRKKEHRNRPQTGTDAVRRAQNGGKPFPCAPQSPTSHATLPRLYLEVHTVKWQRGMQKRARVAGQKSKRGQHPGTAEFAPGEPRQARSAAVAAPSHPTSAIVGFSEGAHCDPHWSAVTLVSPTTCRASCEQLQAGSWQPDQGNAKKGARVRVW